MRVRYVKQDLINIGILSFLYILIIVCMVGTDKVYGSQLDWENQHWAIPEYLRSRFYDTGQFFPNFAFEAGGGQNIYYFAYYGLHSPFLYLSYCLPFIGMRSYIIGVNIISVFAAVWLFYIWVRGKYGTRAAFFTAFLFLTSTPLIFHSHRHIMFVDYIPFLILAFIAVRRYMYRRGSLAPVIACSFLLVTTSFYFSVGSFVAVGVYSVMLYLEKNADNRFHIKDCIKCVMPVAGAALIAILTAGILLLPTALALIGSRGTVAANGEELSILLPGIKADLIMHGAYAMGMSAFSVYALAAAVIKGNRPYSLVAAMAGLMCVFPIIVYVLNGGLYLDGKVLIPFLPLVLMATAEFINDIISNTETEGIKKAALAGTLINALLCVSRTEVYGRLALAAELLVLGVSFYFYNKDNKSNKDKSNKNKKRHANIVCIPALVLSFIICMALNLSDNLVVKNPGDEATDNAVRAMEEEAAAREESIYRFSNGCGRWRNVNRVMSAGCPQAAVYSSTCNKYFKDFYINRMRNELPYRNNAILSASDNVLYNIYMGVKYYITGSSYVPAGYVRSASKDKAVMYSSEDAYPIGYATAEHISEDCYDSLGYPYNIGALMKYAVTDHALYGDDKEAGLSGERLTGITRITPAYTLRGSTDSIEPYDGGYMLKLTERRELLVDLEEPLDDKLLFIRFDVDNETVGESEDVSVSINGTSNKLSQADWKYHNGNYSFEYVLSSDAGLSTLKIILSKGSYTISNIECYVMDYEDIRRTSSSLDEFFIDKSRTSGDTIAGEIEVKSDGWFHMSVPYDKGFRVLVDGEETEYFPSDKDFIGFNIKEGRHDIVITYTAPGFEAGKYISIVGAAVWALYLLMWINGRLKGLRRGRNR